MKNNRFKYQIEAGALQRMRKDDELYDIAQETKPSRLENKRIRGNRHELTKDKKHDKWN